jgi:hypothetical protein
MKKVLPIVSVAVAVVLGVLLYVSFHVLPAWEVRLIEEMGPGTSLSFPMKLLLFVGRMATAYWYVVALLILALAYVAFSGLSEDDTDKSGRISRGQ